MNACKISLMIIAAIFCFAGGIYFHSALPEGKRELASLSSATRVAPKAGKKNGGNVKASKALKSCLAEKTGPGKIELSKVTVDGRNWAIVSMDCVGSKAKDLYEAVTPFSSEQYVRYSDGRRGVARFFGRLYPPSQCVRVIRTSKGSELNLYSCSVRVDLDHEMTESLKF